MQNCKTGDLVPFSAAVQSYTGDVFRILIKPESDCFSYVIYENPTGDDAAVLFAGPMKSGEIWLSMDLMLLPPEGEESFFIIMSRLEQKTLGERISAFNVNPGNTIQRRALMNEVFRIRSENSKFNEAPEKPMIMGGVVRTGTPEKTQGVEFSGLETYVKTISIQH